jgi:hypothetical protein
MPVDASTLQAFLHQNYTPFCDNIDQCAALCDNISVADSMRPAHEEVRLICSLALFILLTHYPFLF